MIKIQQSKTADSRTCDSTTVSKMTLLQSSNQHRGDVKQGLDYFAGLIKSASVMHDHDKLSDIDGFHADFITGFEQQTWWENHQKVNRHHLFNEDGVPEDVNLVDVIELVVDCVMAGMGRSGEVYPLELPPELLEKAFQNTVDLLKSNVEVEE